MTITRCSSLGAGTTLQRIRKETGLPNQPTKVDYNHLVKHVNANKESRFAATFSIEKAYANPPFYAFFPSNLPDCRQFSIVVLFCLKHEALQASAASLLLSDRPAPAIAFFFPDSQDLPDSLQCSCSTRRNRHVGGELGSVSRRIRCRGTDRLPHRRGVHRGREVGVAAGVGRHAGKAQESLALTEATRVG
jgi:hypothetical protein